MERLVDVAHEVNEKNEPRAPGLLVRPGETV